MLNPDRPINLLMAIKRFPGGLHHAVPISKLEKDIREKEVRYFKNDVLEPLEKLMVGNSSFMNEFLLSLFHDGSTKSDFLDRFSGEAIDAPLRLRLAEWIVTHLNDILEPSKINSLITKEIEKFWLHSMETANAGKWKDDLTANWERYLIEKKELVESGDLYALAQHSLTCFINLWCASDIPGQTKVYLSTAKQLLLMAQCTPIFKSLLYSILDKAIKLLQNEPKKMQANLNKKISLLEMRERNPIFKDECMKELASLALDLLKEGYHYADLSKTETAVLSLPMRFAKWGWTEEYVIDFVKGKLNVMLQEKYELSFSGILASTLARVDIWMNKEIPK